MFIAEPPILEDAESCGNKSSYRGGLSGSGGGGAARGGTVDSLWAWDGAGEGRGMVLEVAEGRAVWIPVRVSCVWSGLRDVARTNPLLSISMTVRIKYSM